MPSGCDFTTYNGLRDTTRNAAGEAATSCVSVETAEAALIDAEAALASALAIKANAYQSWETAERAENAEATKLGISPTPTTP